MKQKNVIILIIGLLLAYGIWKISWAVKRNNDKKKFIDACKAEQSVARYAVAPVECEKQWINKQQAK